VLFRSLRLSAKVSSVNQSASHSLEKIEKEKDYHMKLTREKIKNEILRIFSEEFEIENPGLDDNLREVHEFDSIDAIELLGEIETLLDSELTHDAK